MTTIAPPPAPERTPPPPARARQLPAWLRSTPKRPVVRRPAPTAKDARWWVGVVWFVLAGLLLGLVSHATVTGSLQHVRSQQLLYQQLRSELAEAITPLGQLDVDNEVVANGAPIALLEIPRLGLVEVIVQGTTSSDLTNGPGHRRDTVYPGQEGTSVIMGRQTTFGAPFGSLGSLRPGDKITVTTGQGEAKYTVFGVRTEGDLLPESLEKDAGRLELITATGIPLWPSGTIHIDAELTSDVQETPSAVFTKEVLDESEWPMAVDAGAWFPLLFWVLLLSAAAIGLRWSRTAWGVWQTWIISVPLLLSLGAATANAAIATLPNLL